MIRRIFRHFVPAVFIKVEHLEIWLVNTTYPHTHTHSQKWQMHCKMRRYLCTGIPPSKSSLLKARVVSTASFGFVWIAWQFVRYIPCRCWTQCVSERNMRHLGASEVTLEVRRRWLVELETFDPLAIHVQQTALYTRCCRVSPNVICRCG